MTPPTDSDRDCTDRSGAGETAPQVWSGVGEVLRQGENPAYGRCRRGVPPRGSAYRRYWRSAHGGLDRAAIDPVDGHPVLVRELLDRLVELIRPALEQLGDLGFVTEGLAALLERGNGARRQLNAFRARGDLSDVVSEIAEATLSTCR